MSEHNESTDELFEEDDEDELFEAEAELRGEHY